MRFNREKFFSGYRAEFGKLSNSEVEALEFLLTSFENDSAWSDIRHIGYALATMRVETYIPKTGQRYETVTEFGGDSYFKKYDGRSDLGNSKKGDGLRYKGRGYVQITGRTNYTKFGIADEPEKALQPSTAFQIMTRGMFEGIFTGKKLSTYINDKKTDYVNARRIINRLDRAEEIAGYAKDFEKILRDSVVEDPIVKPKDLAQADNTGLSNVPDVPLQPPSNSGELAPADLLQDTVAQNQPPTSPQTLAIAQTTPIEVPQVKPEEEKPDLVSRFSARFMAIPASVTAFLAAVAAWIKDSPLNLILALLAAAAVITVVYVVANMILKNSRERRENDLKREREERAFQLQVLTLKSAADPNQNSVVIMPTKIENSDNAEVKDE